MITDQIQKPSEIKSWAGTIPVHNLYTAGVAGEKFLRAIQKEARLLAYRSVPVAKRTFSRHRPV